MTRLPTPWSTSAARNLVSASESSGFTGLHQDCGAHLHSRAEWPRGKPQKLQCVRTVANRAVLPGEDLLGEDMTTECVGLPRNIAEAPCATSVAPTISIAPVPRFDDDHVTAGALLPLLQVRLLLLQLQLPLRLQAGAVPSVMCSHCTVWPVFLPFSFPIYRPLPLRLDSGPLQPVAMLAQAMSCSWPLCSRGLVLFALDW